MLIQLPETPSLKQPNPVLPDPTPGSVSPKRWLNQESGGAVGLGIVAAIMSTSPVAITSPKSAGGREETHRHGHKSKRGKSEGLFSGSPPKSFEKEVLVPAFTEADFLSHCCLCRKQLHGKDVYMYQEMAFCSTDCRHQQIASDELQEKCGRTQTSDISCSPCSSSCPVFFTSAIPA